MRLAPALALLAALAACAPAPAPDAAAPAPAAPAPAAPADPPAFPSLGAALPAGHTAYANDSLARLLVTLTHETEGGAIRPHLVRYEKPVAVSLEGPGAGRHAGFLDGFLAQLRGESGVRIARAGAGETPNLMIRFVDGAGFARVFAGADCVTALGDVPWTRVAADPGGRALTGVHEARRLERMTVFIPDTLPPHLVRECLLEEIPQALGPINDLYGLGSSVFNDDGAHIWPTKLDLLMLRVIYAPELTTGLDRRATERRARAALARENPEGAGAPPLPALEQRRLGDWPELMAAIFSRGVSEQERIAFADRALAVVEARAPGSARHCHTLLTAGRAVSRRAPDRALALYDRAGRTCEAAHGPSDIRQARIALERACALSRLGEAAVAAELAEATWPVLAAHGQDERLAALYTIQADALATIAPDSPRAAEAARLAEAWSAYAVGPDRRAADCRPATAA